jgi:hypothetical protein
MEALMSESDWDGGDSLQQHRDEARAEAASTAAWDELQDAANTLIASIGSALRIELEDWLRLGVRDGVIEPVRGATAQSSAELIAAALLQALQQDLLDNYLTGDARRALVRADG